MNVRLTNIRKAAALLLPKTMQSHTSISEYLGWRAINCSCDAGQASVDKYIIYQIKNKLSRLTEIEYKFLDEERGKEHGDSID
jgi:hypothetical protein